MNTFKQAAIEILKENKGPLHYIEITRRALESGILESQGESPVNTMNAQLSVDIKTKGTGSEFIRIPNKKGFYFLNINKKEATQNQKIFETEKREDEKIKVEGSFIGKAGEHLVCSELLFRRFNASIMSVDIGIDISAIKDNKFYGIQVKTACKSETDTYNFHIRRSSFEKHNLSNTFYVFVLNNSTTKLYFIIPSNIIEKNIKNGGIYAVNNNTGYSISVKCRNKKWYLGKKINQINNYLNNWDLIK
ncbi:MAG TPA: winged helix-turn-helix domain-containing protein [Bacteroidia bacterium]|nr:winged helix-turn-helix domain-containing protein [Bacteroidia bacterium]